MKNASMSYVWNRSQLVAGGMVVALMLGVATLPPALAHPNDEHNRNGPTVAEGQVRGQGKGPAAGAKVLLLAAPNDEALAAQEIGQSLPMAVVDVTHTDEHGRFDLCVPDDFVTAPYETDAVVNFRIITNGPEGSAGFGFPRQRVKDGKGRAAWHPLEGDEVYDAELVELDLVAGQGTDLTPEETTAANDAVDRQHRTDCKQTLLATYKPKATRIGSAFTSAKTIANFTYTANASSSLGIGMSTKSTSGFSLAGTTAKSSTDKVNFGEVPASTRRAFFTYYEPAKWEIRCPQTPVQYEVSARRFTGGGATGTPTSTPSATWCVTMNKGIDYTKANSTAVTFSQGFQVDSIIGINLSSRTGFASTTKLKYGPWTSNGQLCGTNDYPGGTPRQLVGK